MPYITEELLRSIAPKSKIIPELVHHLNLLFEKYQINTPERISAFLSQAATETGGFIWLSEAGWCSEKKAREFCQRYEPGTKKGKELGNFHAGDGYLYRGRGLFQLTGRYNYERYSKILGVDLHNNPEMISQNIHLACLTACEYWQQKGMNQLADKGQLNKITTVINGGTHKLEERKYYYNVFMSQFSSDAQFDFQKSDKTFQPNHILNGTLCKPHFNPGVYAVLSNHCYTPKEKTPEGFNVFLNSKKYIYDPFRTSSFFAGYVKSAPPIDPYYQQFHAGFHATAYINFAEQVVVIAATGTDFSNANGDKLCNLVSDIQLGLRIIPAGQQYYDAFYKEVQRELKIQYPHLQFKIEHTGHSLGAARAQLAGVAYPKDVVVTFDGPGVRELLPKEIQANSFNNVTNYIIFSNAINDINTRIGSTYQLTLSAIDNHHIAKLRLHNWLMACHEIKTFIKAFDMSGDPLYPVREQKLKIEKIIPQQIYYGSPISPNLVNSVLRSSGVREEDFPDITEQQITERIWQNVGRYKFTYYYETQTEDHALHTGKQFSNSSSNNFTPHNEISIAFAEHIANLSGLKIAHLTEHTHLELSLQSQDKNAVVFTYSHYLRSLTSSPNLSFMRLLNMDQATDHIFVDSNNHRRIEENKNHFEHLNTINKSKLLPIYSLKNTASDRTIQNLATTEKIPTNKLMALTKVFIDITMNQQNMTDLSYVTSKPVVEPSVVLFNFDLVQKPQGIPIDSNISFLFDTQNGFSANDYSKQPDITFTGSLFRIGKGGLILAPTIGAKIAFDTTPVLLASAGIGLGIGLGILGAAYGVKKLVDHIQWSHLPADRKAEANLETAISKLNSAKQKEFSWNNYSIVYWTNDWNDLIKHRESNFKKALLDMRNTHNKDEATVYDCDAFLYALENKDPSLDPKKVRTSYSHHLSSLFNHVKDGLEKQDYGNAKKAADELLSRRPNSFVSHVAMGLALEPENMSKATESFVQAISLAKDEKDKQMLNEQMFCHLWRKAEFHAILGNNSSIQELRNFINQRNNNQSLSSQDQDQLVNTYLYNFKDKKFFDSHHEIITGLEEAGNYIELPNKFQLTLANAYYSLANNDSIDAHEKLSNGDSNGYDFLNQKANVNWQNAVTHFEKLTQTELEELDTNVLYNTARLRIGQGEIIPSIRNQLTITLGKYESITEMSDNQKRCALQTVYGLVTIAKQVKDFSEVISLLVRAETKHLYTDGSNELSREIAIAHFELANSLKEQAIIAAQSGDQNESQQLLDKAKIAANHCKDRCNNIMSNDNQDNVAKLYFSYACLSLNDTAALQMVRSTLNEIIVQTDNLKEKEPQKISKEQSHQTALACVAMSQTELLLHDTNNHKVKLQAAISYREKAIAYNDELHEEIKILGELYESDGKFEQATIKFQLYLTKNPSDEKAVISCARVLCKQNKFEDAKARLTQSKQFIENKEQINKSIAAINQFESSSAHYLIGELIGFGIHQGINYLIDKNISNIDKEQRTYLQQSVSIFSDVYGCASGFLFKFMQDKRFYSLLGNLGGADQVPSDWHHFVDCLTPNFVMSKTVQGIGILRKNTTWFDDGHAKTVADIAEHAESGIAIYNQLAELLYDDGAGGTFLDTVDPYVSVGSILARRINAYIDSHKINRQQMFESPFAYLMNDVARGVGIASTVYAIARKYPEHIIVNAIKTYAPYAVQAVAGQILLGLTVAYLAYKGYQRYQAKSLEAIKHNGLMLANEGKFDEAIHKFENYLTLKRDDAEVNLALNKIKIVVGLKNQAYSKVIQDCNKHLQDKHSDDYIWFRAQAYFAQGELQLAKTDYLKLNTNPYALSQLAFIYQATGDLHQAKNYCNAALQELQNQLISTEKDIKTATEKKWHLGGLVEKTYAYVKNHRSFFNFFGINDGSFKYQLMLEESAKKREHIIKEISEMKEKQLTGIETAIVDAWLNFCGDIAGNLAVTMLQFIQFAVTTYIQQPSKYNAGLPLPETNTAYLVHPLRRTNMKSSAERFVEKTTQSQANNFVQQQLAINEKRSQRFNGPNTKQLALQSKNSSTRNAEKYMQKKYEKSRYRFVKAQPANNSPSNSENIASHSKMITPDYINHTLFAQQQPMDRKNNEITHPTVAEAVALDTLNKEKSVATPVDPNNPQTSNRMSAHA